MFVESLEEGRGVIVFIKHSLNAEQFYFDTNFKESVWCKIKLKNRDNLLIGCIYRSPNATDDNFQELKSLFYKCRDANFSHKLLIGDFNLKDINWCEMTTQVNEAHIASQFLECVRDSYFTQHVKNPTRYREGNVSSVLDLIFTNEEDMVNDITFLPGLGKSDHLLLDFSLDCYTEERVPTKNSEKLNFFKGDYANINNQLLLIDWQQELDGLNLLQSWDRFAEKSVNLITNNIPVSKSTPEGKKSNPFITRSCLEAIKQKRTRWLKYKYFKTDSTFNKYKAARNTVTNKLRAARYSFEKNLASKIKTDNKLFWNYVRSKTRTKSVVSKLVMPNGNLTSTDQETANTLNEYFSTVFEVEPDGPLPPFENRPFRYQTDNIVVTENDVEKSLAALKPSKSQGPDLFHPKFLKETKDNITKPLKTIFQKSMDESILPPIWKKANISAIFKKGEKKKPENYRPISLTSVPCKLMEKLVRDIIVRHMTENNLFSNAQHGFIKGKSCVTQLLEFLEDITQSIDNGDEVDVIYLDFCKAFDKVPHQRLLQKLYAYGIRGKVHTWVKEFLSGREQRVIVNGSQSTWINITSGIPQGSVLGPVLFLVFINDLPEVIKVLIKLFADDAKLYSVVTSNADNRAQFSLNRAVDWSKVWKMIFNIIKCHHLHIGKKFTETTYTMESDGQQVELEKVKNEKDLGVIIDQTLRKFLRIDSVIFVNLYQISFLSLVLNIYKKCLTYLKTYIN